MPSSASASSAALRAPPPSPPRQRRKQERPRELLDAALELFAEKGFAATRTEEVARRAGVSKGTLYLYYPSKEELFKAVVRQNLTSLIAAGEELVLGFQGNTSELLRVLLTTWWERVGNTAAAGIHKVVFAEARNFPGLAAFYTAEVIGPADRLFSATLRRGGQRGEFRAMPEHDVAHALMAPLIFMTLCRQSFGAGQRGAPAVDPQALIATHLDLVLHGLLARPVPPPARTPAKNKKQVEQRA
jgi:AcrR family transcriptional regulator